MAALTMFCWFFESQNYHPIRISVVATSFERAVEIAVAQNDENPDFVNCYGCYSLTYQEFKDESVQECDPETFQYVVKKTFRDVLIENTPRRIPVAEGLTVFSSALHG